jgi:hypothetical protein
VEPGLASGDGEEPSVLLHVPPPGQARLLEGDVEGDAVSVALAVDQRPVDVEYDRLEAQVTSGRSAGIMPRQRRSA